MFEPLSAHRAMSAHGVDQVGFEERHILHSIRQHGTHGERASEYGLGELANIFETLRF